MQRELQGQVQRKEVERRYRDKCNKGPERDCLLDFPFCPLCSFAYISHPFRERVQTGGAERVSVRGLRGGAQRDADR